MQQQRTLTFGGTIQAKSPWIGLLMALLLTLPALWPLLALQGLPATPDGPHHLFRLLDFDLALRGDDLYPRWLANHGFGYGFPTLNFYAPLTYYLAELPHLLGFGFITSLKLVIAVGFLVAAALNENVGSLLGPDANPRSHRGEKYR